MSDIETIVRDLMEARWQAAGEIERLRAENEKLQWELGKALDTLVVHDAVCDEVEKLRAAVKALVPVVDTFVNPIRSPDPFFAMQYHNGWRNEGAKALIIAKAALEGE